RINQRKSSRWRQTSIRGLLCFSRNHQFVALQRHGFHVTPKFRAPLGFFHLIPEAVIQPIIEGRYRTGEKDLGNGVASGFGGNHIKIKSSIFIGESETSCAVKPAL